MQEIFHEIKKKSELVTIILFYLAAALCLVVYIGNFRGGFLPVMGNLITMILRVAILLVVPVLLSMRKAPAAKVAFLGVSAYWLLNTVFDMLGDAGAVSTGVGSVFAAMGAFAFLIAVALIVTTVFAVLFKWKDSLQWKVLALGVFCLSLLFFIVFFSLWTALYADWGFADWSDYMGFVYTFLIVPVAMLFGAINFWFDGSEIDEFIKQVTQSSVAVKEEKKTIEPLEEEAGYEDAEELDEFEELEPLPPVKPAAEKKPVKEQKAEKTVKPVPEQPKEEVLPLEIEEIEAFEEEILPEEKPAPAPAKQEEVAVLEASEEELPAAAPAEPKKEAEEVSFETDFVEQKEEEEPEEVTFTSESKKQENKGKDEDASDDDDFLKAFAED